MVLSDIIPEVKNLVNNSAITNSQIYNWANATLHEIGGNWNFLLQDKVISMDTTNKYVTLPDVVTVAYVAPDPNAQPPIVEVPEVRVINFDELIEPIFFTTDTSGIGTVDSNWETPDAMWEFEDMYHLYSHQDDFRLSELLGIEFNSRWNTTAGSLWVRYYRKLITLTSVTDNTAFDLPDEFVYRLMTFGAARYGLIQEDDNERFQVCTAEFMRAVRDMRISDGKRMSANGIKLLKSHGMASYGRGPMLPGNYSV